jgi:hypothetical protein
MLEFHALKQAAGCQLRKFVNVAVAQLYGGFHGCRRASSLRG